MSHPSIDQVYDQIMDAVAEGEPWAIEIYNKAKKNAEDFMKKNPIKEVK